MANVLDELARAEEIKALKHRVEDLEDRTTRIEQERAEVASAWGGVVSDDVPAAPAPIPSWADVCQLILAIAPQFKHELTVNALLADFPRWLSEVKSMRRVLDISQEDNRRLADRANDERTKRVELSGRIEVMRSTIAARLRTAPSAQAAFTFNREQLEAWIRELESGAPSDVAEATANANAIGVVIDMLANAGQAPDATCNARENLINLVDRAIRHGAEGWERYHAQPAELLDLDVLFDGPPGPEGPRFVEVESPPGRSVCVGDWVEREPIKAEDGRPGPRYWALRIPRAVAARPALTRDEAIAIARDCAREQPQSYVDTSKIGEFAPHEWVISAIIRASSDRPHTFATLPSIPAFREMVREGIAAAAGKVDAEPPRGDGLMIDGKLYRQPSIAELRVKARVARDEADAWRTAASYGISPDVPMRSPEDLRTRLMRIDEYGQRRAHELETARAEVRELRDTVARIGAAYDKGVELWREHQLQLGNKNANRELPPVRHELVGFLLSQLGVPVTSNVLALNEERTRTAQHTVGLMLQAARGEITETTNGVVLEILELRRKLDAVVSGSALANKQLSAKHEELQQERIRTAGLAGARDKAVAERDSALSEIERANKALDHHPSDDVVAGIERLRELRTKAMRGEAEANAHAGKAWAAIIEIAKLTGSPEETPNVVVQQVVTLQQTVAILRRQREEARGVAKVAEGEAIEHRDILSDTRHLLTQTCEAYRRAKNLPADASVTVPMIDAALANGAVYEREVREAHELLTSYQVNETDKHGAILSITGRIKAMDRRDTADRDRSNEAIHAALDRIETEYSGHHPVERIDGIGLRLRELEAKVRDLSAAESAAAGNIRDLTAALESARAELDAAAVPLEPVRRERWQRVAAAVGLPGEASHEAIAIAVCELADRVVTIADEGFGPFPVQSASDALTEIERGIFEMRQARTRREGVVATAQLLVAATEAHAKHGDEPNARHRREGRISAPAHIMAALQALELEVQKFETDEADALDAVERGERSHARVYPGPWPEWANIRGRSREDVSPERLAELRAIKPSVALNDASARELRALANEVTRGRYEADLLRRNLKLRDRVLAEQADRMGTLTSGDAWVDDARRGVVAAAQSWFVLRGHRRTADEALIAAILELGKAEEARRERCSVARIEGPGDFAGAVAVRCPTAVRPLRATVHYPDGTSQEIGATAIADGPLKVDRQRFLGLSPTADRVGRTLESYGARVAYAKDCTGRAAMEAEVVVHPETGDILKDSKAYSAAQPAAALVHLMLVIGGHEYRVSYPADTTIGAVATEQLKATGRGTPLQAGELVVLDEAGTEVEHDVRVGELRDQQLTITTRTGHGG